MELCRYVVSLWSRLLTILSPFGRRWVRFSLRPFSLRARRPVWPLQRSAAAAPPPPSTVTPFDFLNTFWLIQLVLFNTITDFADGNRYVASRTFGKQLFRAGH